MLDLHTTSQALGHGRETSVALETDTQVPASPPCDTWLCAWSQVSHSTTPPLPLSSISFIYVQQCKSESSKSLLLTFTDIPVRLWIPVLKGGVYPVTIGFSRPGWCQGIGLVFTMQHSCNSSLQEGPVIDRWRRCFRQARSLCLPCHPQRFNLLKIWLAHWRYPFQVTQLSKGM